LKRFERQHWHKLQPLMQEVVRKFLVKKIRVGMLDDLPECFAPPLIEDDASAFEKYALEMSQKRIGAGVARSLLEGLKMRNCPELKEKLKKINKT